MLVALLLSFTIFSNCVYAAEVATDAAVEVDPYGVATLALDEDSDSDGQIRIEQYIASRVTWASWANASSTFTPGLTLYKTLSLNNDTVLASNGDVMDMLKFRMVDNTAMFESGQGATITVGNLINYIEYSGYYDSTDQYWSGTKYFDVDKITRLAISYYDSSGARIVETLATCDVVKNGNTLYSVTFDVAPQEKDVYEIRLYLWYDMYDAYGLDSDHFTDMYYTDGTYVKHTMTNRYMGYENSTMTIDLNDESIGLISGIIEWVKSIYNSIVELPEKIWSYISDGLKGLFIPSEESITQMKDKWDELLADRFGAVYQAGSILTDFASGLSEQAEQDTIELPSVTHNFSGTEFSFGGYQVDIVPDGFDFLVDILKGVIDIVCTIAFLNTLRNKYEQLMGG